MGCKASSAKKVLIAVVTAQLEGEALSWQAGDRAKLGRVMANLHRPWSAGAHDTQSQT